MNIPSQEGESSTTKTALLECQMWVFNAIYWAIISTVLLVGIAWGALACVCHKRMRGRTLDPLSNMSSARPSYQYDTPRSSYSSVRESQIPMRVHESFNLTEIKEVNETTATWTTVWQLKEQQRISRGGNTPDLYYYFSNTPKNMVV